MVDSLAERGRSHTRLRELLDARETLLHANEREQLLDAADAQLFDEMVESGRWIQGPADEVLAAIEGCRGGAQLAAG